tara:strand:+ start:3412 stop:3792 length:381 start_codon:yes stop_codon:yes gene_type:complete
MKLIKHPDIYIGDAPGKGRGVFTSTFIKKDTIIEECPHLPLFGGRGIEIFSGHTFSYPDKKPHSYTLLLGFGTLYNHNDSPNIISSLNLEKDVYIIKAIKDIESGEEICMKYGSAYFTSRPNLIKV